MKVEQDMSHKTNWDIWYRILSPLRDIPAKILEIGSFEGESTRWFLENILIHKDAKIYCIDPWEYGDNYYSETYDMTSVKDKFSSNLSDFQGKWIAMQGYSFHVLCKIHADIVFDTIPRFSAIYIDGDHRTLPIMQDCVLSWPLLLPGGVMIFDDYEGVSVSNKITEYPGLAIDNFLQMIAGQYETLFHGYQLIIRRKANL